MEKLTAVTMVRNWVEHSPPATNDNPDLIGFTGLINVCSGCASRVFARGFSLRDIATTPVWRPESLDCDVCLG